METYLQGQDLLELLSGADAAIPDDTPDNAEPQRKWKIKFGKTLLAQGTSISKEFTNHVCDISLPKEAWMTLEGYF